MSDVDWSKHSIEEVLRALKTAPRIFGEWEGWTLTEHAWSRHQLRFMGRVSVQRTTGYPGYGVTLWDGSYTSDFPTPEEAKDYADAAIINAGHRIIR